MKKTVLSMIFALLLAGCGAAVQHTVSADYALISPKRVAVLPLVWEGKASPDAEEISLLFRKMAAEKLEMLHYSTVPLDEVNKAGGPGWFDRKPAHEVASRLNADSVLYIRVKDWDTDSFASYKSLKITAAFELHSAADKALWTAEFSTSEADVGLDSRPMELAVHKAYEPRVQRFIDAVFTTLPPGEAKESQRKTYFQWLP